MESRRTPFFLFIIFATNLLVWFKSLSLDFYNDDYQILGYAKENFVANPLAIFTSKDVSNYYYRPIPNLFHSLMLSVFGFNALPFRILNFAIYFLLIFFVYLFLYKFFGNKYLAFFPALLFSLLPSHDLFLVWLASLGDTLATLFILIAFYFLLFSERKSSFYFALLFFILSIFSKESTVLTPLFAFSISPIFVKKKETLQKFALYTFLFIALLFLFRHFILGINIFASPNAQNFSFGNSLLNLFLYPFVFVVPTFAYTSQNPLGILLNVILLFSLLTVFILYIFKNSEKDWRPILFGLLWYVFFVIPVLPLFMRWYSFLPSFGMVVLATELLKQIKHKHLVFFVLPIAFILAGVDYYSTSGWKKSNIVSKKILSEIARIDTQNRKNVLLWFFPQYYNNYPILRSGVHQAVNFQREEKLSEVLLPISIALSQTTKVELIGLDRDSVLTFKIEGASVFLSSRTELISSETQVENDYYHLQILPQASKPTYVKLRFVRTKPEFCNFYFNGYTFIEF